MATTPPRFKLLYVCAGNTARSPLAVAYTRHYVDQHGAGARWEIGSAGTQAIDGDPARPEVLSVSGALGFDLTGHEARSVKPDDIEACDLILAMAWEQAAHLWSLAPESWGRSFTIKEFIHWSKQVAPRPAILFPDQVARMRDRVDQAHALRRRARADFGFWGGLRPQDLNVIEPEGKGDAAWRSFAQVMRALVTDVVHLLGGP